MNGTLNKRHQKTFLTSQNYFSVKYNDNFKDSYVKVEMQVYVLNLVFCLFVCFVVDVLSLRDFFCL